MALAASDKGLKLIAITDHGSALPDVGNIESLCNLITEAKLSEDDVINSSIEAV